MYLYWVESGDCQQYAILKLPTNILVSPGGRILARDIPTDSLNHEVEKVLKKEKK